MIIYYEQWLLFRIITRKNRVWLLVRLYVSTSSALRIKFQLIWSRGSLCVTDKPLELINSMNVSVAKQKKCYTWLFFNCYRLGLQTLNPQQNYFPLKTETSDYHYPETSKTHTSLYHNSITSTKDDKNDHDTTWNTRGDLIIRVNHRYIAFDNN
jgi:hypothetical protein